MRIIAHLDMDAFFAAAEERESLKLFLPFLDRRENPKKKLIRLLGVKIEKLS